MPVASVIISTFDQPNALRLVLAGYQAQSYKDFEILVADDGSDDETKKIIHDFALISNLKIKHCWQENKGFRKAKIVNKAFKLSEGEAVVFSDGDCIPQEDFVSVHLQALKEDSFGVGGYIRLPPDYCKQLTCAMVLNYDHERFITMKEVSRFYIQHIKSLFYIAIKKKNRPKIYGCNISLPRGLFETVNGYDENFDGFDKEDSDLRNRLILLDARPVSLWGKAIVFHLDQATDPKNQSRRIPRDREKEIAYYHRENVKARCENGLVKEGAYQK